MNQIKLNTWEICSVPQENRCRGTYPDSLPENGWYRTDKAEDVHTVLLKQGIIPDPAYGTGDASCAWIEKMAWVYRSSVCCSEEELTSPILQLVLEGVDTYADLFVNGRYAGHFENMFCRFCVDLCSLLHSGKNEILLVFASLPAVCASRQLPDGFWTNYSTERAFARKAGYSFGWDWSPRVITVGLWKDVMLQWGTAVFGEVSAEAEPDDSLAHAQIRVKAEVLGQTDSVCCRAELFDADGKPAATAELRNGEATLILDDPKLWWTRELGTPYLYSLHISLLADGHLGEERILPIGIRQIRIVKKDADGRSCYLFKLNGKPLFLRGANWVPLSNRPGATADAEYEKMIAFAVDAGMNFLVLWGGGIYERDIFYELCDQQGILLWQYFMFACGEYPDYDPDFLSSVKEECRQAVINRKHHPSIALWIGNVENEMLCQKIGQQRSMYGAELFERLLPEWLKEWDPGREYVPSSPWGEKLMNSMTEYDRHNWDLWFNDRPYTDYAEDTATFASEFGIHGAPSMQCIKRFCGTENPAMDDFLFQYMNRDADPERMAYYMRTHVGMPRTVPEYVRNSMLVQAEALAFACDHYRRRFPLCGGAAVWQLNDCCAAHSWSLVDYEGIPKAAYYAVRRSFRPIAVSIRIDKPNIAEVFLCCHRETRETVTVCVEVSDFFGERSYFRRITVPVSNGSVTEVDKVAIGGRFYPNAILRNRPRLYYTAAWIEGEPSSMRTAFVAEQKDLLLPPAKVTAVRRVSELTVRSDRFLRFAHLEAEDLRGLEPEDNYFDVLPGQERRILLRGFREGITPPLKIVGWNGSSEQVI